MGELVNTYYQSGRRKSHYNDNGGNEKVYVYDEETGTRSEPKYQTLPGE